MYIHIYVAPLAVLYPSVEIRIELSKSSYPLSYSPVIGTMILTIQVLGVGASVFKCAIAFQVEDAYYANVLSARRRAAARVAVRRTESRFVPYPGMGKAEAETTLVELRDRLRPAGGEVCPVCEDLIEDAVVLQCCGDSGCDRCK